MARRSFIEAVRSSQFLVRGGYASCFWGEDSLRRVRRASPDSQKRKSRRRAVSMKPVMKRTVE